MNQFITNDGVIINCLRGPLHNPKAKELCSNIDETCLAMEDCEYFIRCLYLEIGLDVMLFMTTEFVQELHHSIYNFGKSDVAGEPGENITMIVRFFLVVFTKLTEINDLPSKAKLHMLLKKSSVQWKISGRYPYLMFN